MVERRGVQYTIEGRDSFSKVFEKFKKDVAQIKTAWADLRKEVANPLNVKRSAQDLKELGSQASPLRSVAKSLERMARALERMNRALGRTVQGFKSAATQANAAARATTRAAGASAQVGQNTRTNVGLTGAWTASLRRALIILGRILSIFILFRAFNATLTGIGNFFRDAFQFRTAIDQAVLGVRGLLLALTQVRDEQGQLVRGQQAFAALTGIARQQVNALRVEGLRTAATFEELLLAFQTGLAPGIRAGLDVDQVRQFTVSISQAASAIGLAQNQLAEEIRSLLQGTISPRFTRIATALGISNDDIRNAREAGTLFEFLQERFEAFGLAAEASLDLVSVKLINFRDLVRQISADSLTETFQTISNLIDRVAAAIGEIDRATGLTINPQVENALRAIDSALSAVLDSAAAVARSFGLDGVENSAKAFSSTVLLVLPVIELIGRVVANMVSGFARLVLAVNSFFLRLRNSSSIFRVLTQNADSIEGAFDQVLQIAGALVGTFLTLRITLLAIEGLATAWAAIQKTIAATTLATSVNLKNAANAMKALRAAALPVLAVIVLISSAFLVFNQRVRSAFLTIDVGGKTLGQRLAELVVDFQTGARLIIAVIDGLFTIVSTRAEAGINALFNTIISSLQTRLQQLVELIRGFGGPLGRLILGEDFDNILNAASAVVANLGLALRNTSKDIPSASAQFSALRRELVDIATQGANTKKAIETLLNFSTAQSIPFAEFLGITGEEVGSLFVPLFDAFDRALSTQGESAVQSFLTNVSGQAEEAIQELERRAASLQQELELTRATAGLSGFALEAARSAAEIRNLGESASSVLIGGIENAFAELSRLRREIGAADPTKEQALALQALESQIKVFQSQLSALGDQAQAAIDLRIEALGVEFSTAASFVEQRRRLEVSLVEDIAKLEQGAAANLQKERELALAVDVKRLETRRALSELEFDAQLSGLQQSLSLAESTRARQAIEQQILILERARALELKEEDRLLASALDKLREIQQISSDPITAGGSLFVRTINDEEGNIAAAVNNILFTFRDGLSQALSASIVDAIFESEGNAAEKFRSFAKRLAQIFLEEFLKVRVIDNLLSAASGGSSAGTGGGGGLDVGNWEGGLIRRGRRRARAAHFGPSAVGRHAGGLGRPGNLHPSDTVPAWLAEGEFVQRVSAVQKYGLGVMEALNSGRINPVAMQALAAMSGGPAKTNFRRKAKLGYVTGGPVSGGSNSSGNGLTIVNVSSTDGIAAAMTSAVGKRVIINTVLTADELK